LFLGEDVFGVGKHRHPAPIVQAGVPAHVIDMHVGAEYIVDLRWMDASRSQVGGHRATGLHVPIGPARAGFLVPYTGIHDDVMMARPYKIGLHDQRQIPRLRIHGMWFHPQLMLDPVLWCSARKKTRPDVLPTLVLDNTVDLHRAELLL